MRNFSDLQSHLSLVKILLIPRNEFMRWKSFYHRTHFVELKRLCSFDVLFLFISCYLLVENDPLVLFHTTDMIRYPCSECETKGLKLMKWKGTHIRSTCVICIVIECPAYVSSSTVCCLKGRERQLIINYPSVLRFHPSVDNASVHNRNTKMRIYTTWMVIASGVVSTVISVAAGLVMYLEGLQVIEKTVEETGLADLQALSREGRKSFEVTENHGLRLSDMLRNFKGTSSMELFEEWTTVRFVGETYRSNLVHGIAAYGRNTSNKSQRIYDIVWYDVYKNGVRFYVNARVNSSINTTACPFPCAVTYSIPEPETAQLGPNIYNFTANIVSDEAIAGYESSNIEPGSSWWEGPFIWFSGDGNPYVYLINMLWLPPTPDHNILGEYQSIAVTDVLSEPLRDLMAAFATEAKVMITQVGRGLDSVILTGNFADAEMSRNCSFTGTLSMTAFAPCQKYLMNLTKEFRDLAVELNGTTSRKFRRGSSYWMMKDHLFLKSHQLDTLDDIYLMWFRSISSVNSQLDRALILFIVFAIGVASFDILLGAAEVVLIARPLHSLANSISFLCSLDLRGAETIIKPFRNSVIAECQDLSRGLLFAITSLDEYKAFLPKSLFHDSTESDEAEHSVASLLNTVNTSVSGVSEKKRALSMDNFFVQTALRVGMSRSPMTTMAIKLLGVSLSKGVRSYVDALSDLESVIQSSKGTLHPFFVVEPYVHCATWNGVSSVSYDRVCRAALLLKDKHHIAINSEFSCNSGNVGTATMRSFVVSGMTDKLILPILHAASWLGEKVNTPCVLMTSAVAAKVESTVNAMIVLGLLVQDEIHLLAELQSEKEAKVEEWMYTVSVNQASSARDGIMMRLQDPAYRMSLKDLAVFDEPANPLQNSPIISLAFDYLLESAKADVENAFVVSFSQITVGREPHFREQSDTMEQENMHVLEMGK